MRRPSRRVLPVALVTALVISACSSSNPATQSTASSAPTSTSVATTTTATTLPSTTVSSTVPATTGAPGSTRQEALRVIADFDPATGDPRVLADALAVTGPRPGLGLPTLLEEGSPEIRSVVLEALSGRSVWAVPLLVAMQEFGMPSGTRDRRKLWPSSVKFDISSALMEAADTNYGSLGEMMVDLNRLMVRTDVAACGSEGCDGGGVWYAAPRAVTNPVGTMTDQTRFEGSVMVVSDAGAGDEYPITVEYFESWVPVAGLMAQSPAFGLAKGSGVIFDGVVVTDPTVVLSGWGDSGTTIRVGARSTTVADGWWDLTVPAPRRGENVIEIIGEAPDGSTRAETLAVDYLPTAERTLGFIVGTTTVDGTRALIVDYAEWLSGDEATAAARADGVIGPEDFVDDDYYIRNRNDKLRTLPLADGAVIRLIDVTVGDLSDVTVPVSEFIRMLETGDDTAWYGAAQAVTPYWFIVDQDGVIHQAWQQYTP